MPFVIRNRNTLKYVTSGYSGDVADINNARLFNRKNGATGSSGYVNGLHEVLTVTIIEDTQTGPFRKGRYMTFQEYQDDFGGDYWRVGEIVPSLRHTQHVRDYPSRLTEVFIETGPGIVHQLVLFEKNPSSMWTPEADMCPVYPLKST